MTDLQDAIDGCAAAHARLHATVAGLADDTVRRPSRLPGWTVGHVLTHLARNADSVVRRLDGAARGEVVDQYPGGAEGRTQEIDVGAGRSRDELVADVLAADAAVETTIATLAEEAWSNGTRSLGGEVVPASDVVFSRWREVEVHHVDLGLGYEPADWPAGLVTRWLPRAVAGLAQRSDDHELLAWILDRGPAPELRPWG